MKKEDTLAEIKKLEQNIEKLKKIVEAKDIFSTKSYSKVCEELGEEELKIDNFRFLHPDDRELAFNRAMMSQIERYFNEGWIPDWSNSSEYKYYCYFEYKTGGLAFRDCFVYRDFTGGVVAYFKSREIANHIGKYFSDIHIKCIKQK